MFFLHSSLIHLYYPGRMNKDNLRSGLPLRAAALMDLRAA